MTTEDFFFSMNLPALGGYDGNNIVEIPGRNPMNRELGVGTENWH